MTAPDLPPTTARASEEKIETPLSREALYALVWSEPMLRIAARFGVSSSYLARVCTTMNVPRPERGYWAKLAVGKKQTKPPLPEPGPGDALIWSKGGGGSHIPKALPRPPAPSVRPVARDRPPRTAVHSLLQGAKGYLESGRESYEGKYLKPAKRNLVDFAVTKTGLDKALSFANGLFQALEANGHHVMLAPTGEYFCRATVDERENPGKGHHYNNLWSPGRLTVVYVGTVAIGLTVIELSEEVEVRYVNGEYIRVEDYVPPKRSRYEMDRTWTTRKAMPTARLCPQAYSPYYGTSWNAKWPETRQCLLTGQIRSIVKSLEQAAIEIAVMVEEARRRAKIEQQEREAAHARWQREEAERRAAAALKESREEIHRIVDHWAHINRVERFFSDIERKAGALDANQRANLLQRLQRARQLLGTTDALDHFLTWRMPEER